jgi:type III secretion protein S
MNPDPYASRAHDAMMLVLQITGPILVAGVIVGVTIGLFQALTQIQDQTLPQAVKLLVIIILLIVLGPAFGQMIAHEASLSLDQFPFVTR